MLPVIFVQRRLLILYKHTVFRNVPHGHLLRMVFACITNKFYCAILIVLVLFTIQCIMTFVLLAYPFWFACFKAGLI